MEDDKKFGFSKWGNCLLAVFAFACATPARAAGTLPAGYTRVVGIQSAGLSGNAPYVDLGYKPTQNTRVDIDFELLDWRAGSSALDSYPCPFGACHANNELAFTLTGGFTQSDGNRWSFRWGSGNTSWIIPNAIIEGVHQLEASGPSWTMDGVTKEKTDGSSETFMLTQSLYVFARNNDGKMDHPVYMTLYGFDIYESGVLRHSFVPCVRDDDGEPGLYDTVGDKGFLVKSGTGAFTVGRSCLEMEGVPRIVCDALFLNCLRPVVHPFGDSSTVLVEDRDYTLSYGRSTGTDSLGWVKATGIGDYAGIDSSTIYYHISTNATDAFSVTNIPPVAYKNGEPLTPRPVVRTADESRTLVQGTDYDLSWGNNCEIGRGYVLITGKGDFADKLWWESFSILPVLPGGYKAVEYIRSSGTQYIDTGFKPDVNTRADIHFYMEEFGSWSEWAAPFGSRNANNYQFFVGAARQKVNGTPRDDWYRRFSNKSTDTISTGKPSVVGEHHFSLNKATYTLDAYANTFSGYQTFSKSYNAYVFAVNNNNAATQVSPMKLYSLKIWDDGTLVRDFVPCVNKDGVAGLYDMTPGASKVFYANDGTGEFETGPELESAKAGLSIFVR